MKNQINPKQNWSFGSKLTSLLIVGSAFCLNNLAKADTPLVETYTNATGVSTNWTCPAGVNLVQVEVWGGGGAGGGGLKTTSTTKNGCGGGGGGGAYARFNAYSVTPTSVYGYTVGTNGVGVVTNNGTAGGESWFISSGTLDALGGAGGGAGIGISSGTFNSGNGQGAAGNGATAGSTGDAFYAGGNGAKAPSVSGGGGGGGSGGYPSAGNPASGSTGGAAVTGGGAGGNANTSSGNGTNGVVPGGGGGGAKSGVGGESDTGGNGAPGQVQFTYYITPTTQASGVSFSAVGSSSMTISWTPGSGSNSIVLVKASSAVNSFPVNGTIYTDNVAFGSGSQLGSGNYVAYQGSGSSVTISGLSIGTTYYVSVYSFNGLSSTLAEYNTASPAVGNQATVSAPTVDTPTKSAISVTTATLGATVENNNGGTITNYGVVWSTSANPNIATGTIVVKGTSLSSLPTAFTISATGLPANTVVHYRGYATSAAGTGYSLDDSFLTLSTEPTTPASGASFTSTQGGGATVSWTRGNGAACLVLVKAGAAVSSAPVDGTTYSADPDFGSGSQIGSGNYVAYLGTGTSVTIYALTPSTNYYVAVYELNGSGGSENYLTTSPATANGATVLHSVVYYSGAATADATATGSWWTGTNGTGANPPDFNEGDTFIIQAGQTNWIYEGNTWVVNAANYGTAATVQINTNGTLMFDESTSGAAPVLQLGGNMVQSAIGGLAASFASSVALVEFTSSGTWTGSGHVNGLRLSIKVDGGATLDASGVSDNLQFKQTNVHGLTVNSNAVLNVGSHQVNGDNSTGSAFFTLKDGGTLIEAISSGQGVPGVFINFNTNKVTLSTNANYVFNGTAAQITGTSNNNVTMPATVNNFVISNPAGVTLSQSTTVNGALTNAANSLLDMNSNTLSVAGSSLSSSGTLVMEFIRTSPTSFTGSQLTQTAGTLHFAGTLQVNASGALAAGDQFQLFSSPAYSGSFTTVSGSPGAGLAYSFNTNSGALSVVSTVPPSASIMTSFSGGNLVLTWPNGLGWQLQSQTNSLSIGLTTNWVSVSGATSPFTNSVNAANGTVFYRLTHP